jgi:hypothetical protein
MFVLHIATVAALLGAVQSAVRKRTCGAPDDTTIPVTWVAVRAIVAPFDSTVIEAPEIGRPLRTSTILPSMTYSVAAPHASEQRTVTMSAADAIEDARSTV